MSLVYIAAPLGAPTAALRAWHRERATLLCALAFYGGYVPVCVHPYAETATGSDADPDARERGLARALDAVEVVAKAGGALWVLRRDDGTLSEGCTQEAAQYAVWRPPHTDNQTSVANWTRWRALTASVAPHLLPEFDRLATSPPGPELTGVWDWTGRTHQLPVMCCARTGAPAATMTAHLLRIHGCPDKSLPVGPGDVEAQANAMLRAAGYILPESAP